MKTSLVSAALLLATLVHVLPAQTPKPAPGAIAAAARKARSDQALDEEYTRQIREYTTDTFFSTPYVDHLPAGAGVPTPLDVLGHIAGAADVLSYTHEVNEYMRALADASPRATVLQVGTSEEGREMILVVVGSEDSIANIEQYKEITNALADPRTLTDEDAEILVGEGKAMYWATGAMHSPETGSPEMLMELAYRLAVEESPFIQEIRENLIMLITPVLEVDGRDKRVDLQKLFLADDGTRAPGLVYWGKYVAHDNNRDSMAQGLELSKMLMRVFLDFKPQVIHDLHESASHLYTSTGTGPYNPWLDPMVIDEWHVLAYQEVSEMTRLGVPGVWTHQFYDGWAANYGIFCAQGHNAIGRFYETQGAGNADTRRISAGSSRAWYRPNPPLASTMWSIRNNVNMQQSALLIALNHVANNREKFLQNFYLKSQRSVAKAYTEGPAAYVFPSTDPHGGQQADLLNLLQDQGCEIHQTVRDASIGDTEIPAGSYVVRMDQPYSRMADMLLDRGYFNASEPGSYDDTGWTLGPLFNTDVLRIVDTDVLDVFMEEVPGRVHLAGSVDPLSNDATVGYLINNNADNHLATFRFAHADLRLDAAEEPFTQGGVKFNAGTFIVPLDGNPEGLEGMLDAAAAEYGFTTYSTAELPSVPTHAVSVPRVAIVHNWQSTQDEGWVRMAMDYNAIPYDYVSIHEIRDNANLRDKYDVLLFGPARGDALAMVRGLPMTGKPVAWKKTELTPNIGVQDSTDDMRGGIELEGVMHLRDFLRDGGAAIAIQGSTILPIHFGLAQGVSQVDTQDLRISGSVLRAEFTDELSPIRYGFGEELGVYFRSGPVLRSGGGGFRGRGRRGGGGGSAADRILAGTARTSGRGGIGESDIVQGRSRTMGQGSGGAAGGNRGGRRGGGGQRGQRGQRGGAGAAPAGPQRPAAGATRQILRFWPQHEELLISGMLAGGDELAGTPTVIDAPYGEGHVVLFGMNPMWRHETQGSYALVFNTILHYDHLDAGTRRPAQGVSTQTGDR